MRRLAGLKWIIPAIRAIQISRTNLVWPTGGRVSARYVPNVGMTGTVWSMWIILAVQLLGGVGTGRLIPNSRLAQAVQLGQADRMGVGGASTAGQEVRGTPQC